KDILFVRIDRRRKLHATILLKALGFSDKELLDRFYRKEDIKISEGQFQRTLDYDLLRGQRALTDFVDPETGKIIVKRGRRISVGAIRQMQQAGIESVVMDAQELVGKIAADDIVDKSGEVIV